MGKIVFSCLLTGFGHLNLGLAISKRIFQLYGDDHEIYFLVNQGFAEKLQKINPKIKCLIYKYPSLDDCKNEEESLVRWLDVFGPMLKIKDRVKAVNTIVGEFSSLYEQAKAIYPEITALLRDLKPDLFIYDSIMTFPTGINLGIPHVLLLSSAPTSLGFPKLPVHQSGLPSEYTPENVKLWESFLDQTYRTGENKRLHDQLNAWLKEMNSPVNLDDYYYTLSPSGYFNIYNYPDALDYQIPGKVEFPGEWLKIQSSILPDSLPKPFVLPEKKLAKLGKRKVIYVSVGSISSAYKPLMDHIVEVLSQLPEYSFILSAGPHIDQLEIGENTYAERFVNQLAVLQSVDCYVAHGGNNSLTEAFYIGVPQIVMPLFADQIENATRITEKGLGAQLNPFEFTKEQLAEEIERLTTPEMREKYRKLSEEIRADTSIDKVCEKIVSYCKTTP